MTHNIGGTVGEILKALEFRILLVPLSLGRRNEAGLNAFQTRSKGNDVDDLSGLCCAGLTIRPETISSFDSSVFIVALQHGPSRDGPLPGRHLGWPR